MMVGYGSLAVQLQTVNREDMSSSLPAAVWKFGNFSSPHFYLVSIPGEVKDHTQWVKV